MPNSDRSNPQRGRWFEPWGVRTLLLLSPIWPYAASLGLLAVALLIAHVSVSLASPSGLTLVFLLAVVVSANRFGLWPAVFTSVLGILSWDYFFTQPYYSLVFSDPRDSFALVAFLSVSLVVSGMTAQIQRQNLRLKLLAQSIANSFELSQTLSKLATTDQIAAFAVSQVESMAGAPASMMLVDRELGNSYLLFPPDRVVNAPDRIAMECVLFPFNPRGADAGPSTYDVLSIEGSRGRIGCIGIADRRISSLPAEERRQIEAFLTQTAIAIERAWLTHDIEHAQVVAETERVRNALLTSVSHDLRTPLTRIIGALSTIKLTGALSGSQSVGELLSTSLSEADRLNRFIGNLLDITRFESGALDVPLTAVDLGEVLESALERAGSLLEHHRIEIDVPPDLPEVHANHGLLEQVFFNLLDNAAKYSPPGSKIAVKAGVQFGLVRVLVSDEGRGIPAVALERIFEKFTRFDHEDSVAPGTGLGLMICRGFLSVMKGRIAAANRTDRPGAVFTVDLGIATP